MRLIQQTMTMGGFLSAQIYISRHVWEQEKVQIYEVEKKMEFFDNLRKQMQVLDIKKKTNQLGDDFKVSGGEGVF